MLVTSQFGSTAWVDFFTFVTSFMLDVSTSAYAVPADMVPVLITAVQYSYSDVTILLHICTALRNLIVLRRCKLTHHQIEKLMQTIRFVGYRPAQVLLTEALLFVDPTATLLGLPLRVDLVDHINMRLGESTSVLSIQVEKQCYDFGTVGIDVRNVEFVRYESIHQISLVDGTLSFSAHKPFTLSRLSLSDVVRLACFGPFRLVDGWTVPTQGVYDDDNLRAKVSFLGQDVKLLWEATKDKLSEWDDMTKGDALKYLCDMVNQYVYYSKYLTTEAPSPIDVDTMEMIARYRKDRINAIL
ncbi:hypothetical protein AKO1_015375 [Acrasis kona]|uniref:Uncharacterized protein n=1 Tax=Acrasis kona TaxID=1008807 RepID=A0AAW2YNH3_9EUKA